MTVADLINQLSGLPPMMGVWAHDEDGPLYLIGAEVQGAETGLSYLLIRVSKQPAKMPEYKETYEEQLARQRQKAMDMASRSDEAMKMPKMENI